MDTVDRWLRESARVLATDAVLSQPVSVLQGVTPAAEQALAAVGIVTVLDLGASELFGVARSIADAADRVDVPGAQGPLPADMLDDGARGASAASVAAMHPEVLRTLVPGAARLLEEALPAATVRDLGYWPPAVAARRLVNVAYGGGDAAMDPESPQELQPRMGRLPVDRVQYDVLLFETVLGEAARRPVDAKDGDWADGSGFGAVGPGIGGADSEALAGFEGLEFPLDLTDALLGRGFEQPGFGFVLTMAQSWYSVGLSLGQLLHSLALAPGEATRIAVVDWSRRVATATAEQITENEALAGDLERNRSVTEVTNAVSNEAQKGFSNFNTTGAAWGIGGGAAGKASKGTAEGSAAINFGYSRNDAEGKAFASSQGQRSIAADMVQLAHDKTQQFASLSRGRRASIVSEVSVSEAERLSTRIVANYNHMHALSVLYFEVVQLYRVVTECVASEPVLYVPVRSLDFERAELVDRYRQALARAALSNEARDALLGIESGPVSPVVRPDAFGGAVEMAFFNPSFTPEVFNQRGEKLSDAALRAALGNDALVEANRLRFNDHHARLMEIQVGTVDATQRSVADTLVVTGSQGNSQSLAFQKWARPPKDPARYLPEQGDCLTAFRAQLPAGWSRRDPSFLIEAEAAWRWDLRGEGIDARLDVWPNARMLLELLDPVTLEPTGGTVSFGIGMPPTRENNGLSRMRLATMYRTPASVSEQAPQTPLPKPFDVAAHLRANAMHYTMALLRLADPSLLGVLLGTLKAGGRSLLGQVDPVPMATVGNYLVFRWPAMRASEWWTALRRARGLVEKQGEHVIGRREALVPVASGGVFAEAVLGRFNSAEKLDLTRFWNWQDSPMPLVPPEIVPLQAGIRETATPLAPGQLGSTNLQQQAAPNLRDTSGDALSKAIEAASKGDSFRDMSGMNKLLESGGQAMTLAAQGAQEFMKTAMANVSAYGARVNQGKKMDEEARTNASAARGGPPDTGRGQGSGASQGGNAGQSPARGAAGTDSASTSSESEAFFGPGGGAKSPPGMLAEMVMGALPAGERGAPEVIRAYPGLDAAITEPASRTCCAIFPGGVVGLGLTQYLDPFGLGEHSYGSSGIFPRDTVGQVYTARGGFVDLGHVRDLADTARYLASRAFAWRLPTRASGRIEEERVALRREGGSRTLILTRMVDGCVECASLVGARAAYDLAIWHEIVTWFTAVRYSAFSPEDNFSNLLGALLGATAAATRGKNYNEAMTTLLDDWLEMLQAQPGSTARSAIQQLNGLWFVDDDLAPALLGGSQHQNLLLRRHVQPLPTVTPWLVTDLNGQSFSYADPVAGVHQTTITFELGNAAPEPFVLRLPETGPRGEVISDHYTIEIDVDTRVVPVSILPAGRTLIRSDDLPDIVAQVRTLILARYPRGDQALAP